MLDNCYISLVMLVSPELEVWLLADPDMASSWRGLARALDLASAIPVLEVTIISQSEASILMTDQSQEKN